jgi:hypothetical protein
MPKLSKRIKEPSILVKPVSQFGGLDNIHVALLVLVVILILTIVAISSHTHITLVNVTQGQNCSYGSINGTCATAVHNETQIKSYVERILASYANINGSLSILPFISNVSQINASFIPSLRQWYVSVPYTVPTTSNTYILSYMINDRNLNLSGSFVQNPPPPQISNNHVVTTGVIQLSQKTSCSINGIIPVYWFTDPYAPGALSSLVNETNLQKSFGSKVNITLKVLFTQYSAAMASKYGINNTLNMQKYLLCGSLQKNFSKFVSALNSTNNGLYLPTAVLRDIALQSGLNMSSLDSCISNSQQAIDAQAVLAKYYNITSSSSVITDCQYLSVPQTARNAICYANKTLC